MSEQTNIGYNFPLEKLGSDVARNNYNYQSILNGLIEWDKTTADMVNIRLTKDSDPWYEDYHIPSKKSVLDANTLNAVADSSIGAGLYNPSAISCSLYGGTRDSITSPVDPTDIGDIATIRLNVVNNGDVNWRVYIAPTIQLWNSNETYSAGNIVEYNDIYYVVLNKIIAPGDAPDVGTDYELLFSEWVQYTDYRYDQYVIDDMTGAVYVTTEIITNSPIRPSVVTDGSFELVASPYVTNTTYRAGSYVYTNSKLYVANVEVVNSNINPTADVDNKWNEVVLKELVTGSEFDRTVLFKWTADVNTSNFYIRNVDINDSSEQTDITMRLTVKSIEPSSIYQQTVETFPSSNFVTWPNVDSTIWSDTGQYGPTDDTISITKRQEYSATMIFNHSRPDVTKTINYVNYDGPDLDQGLCIYLPTEVNIGDEAIAYPEDGFTFDFFFRIWPNPAYNGGVTRDHIVNKSHIYVYSADNEDAVTSESVSEPIAKFSMARSTNFYMFGENVTVPDKPVCYRATFIYSASENKWCTLDYYQLPDHIFVGPVGFIDPQNPANMDINTENVGNINPNAANVGYETAAFPMFQDPFSNTDLSPYRVYGDNADEFKNRIISNDS